MSTNSEIFIQGAIPSSLIAATVDAVSNDHHTGAQDLFLGQIRSDKIDGKTVDSIDYSAYEPMALKAFEEVRNETLKQFELSGCYIYHSLGEVKVGEISLFVLVTSKHRKPVLEALPYLVNRIKAEVPIFAREVFEDQTHVWKENK